ncbi:hypothetical protein Afil01_19940 [Actinorhabdospora filicis]|uniref:Uncharacterized protein n=1 Tax=Actinorhabdospora filicis TaxID=1785913 RepID=A0A9W6SJP3_9ACTN|nr:hypothetical protein [Actinorhabdospora filicis]GLZ77187.1 hypothetical protein Afil01_19940 [Actinorhabdospora filicis]
MTATETRIVDPGDPYADPPRDWRRVGTLAGGWLLVWIVLAGLGWVVMQVPALQDPSGPQPTNERPQDAVRSFLDEAYGRGDFNLAVAFQCDTPGAPSAAALRQERDALEARIGTIGTRVEQVEPQSVSGDVATVSAKVVYVADKYVPTAAFVFTLEKRDGWRICGMTREPASWPTPTPS